MPYHEIPDAIKNLNIIPIQENKKTPAVKWQEYQKKQFPQNGMDAWDGNFAVLCGDISRGLVVVDLDSKAIYDKFFADLDTFTVQTPNGGCHLYFYSETTPNKIPKFKGYPIDIQSNGSYVLIPPSELEGKKYIVIKSSPIQENDDVLLLLDSRLPNPIERPSDIEAFKRNLDTSKVIQHYVIPASQGKGYWQGLCPFHEERTPSFTVYRDHYYCFGCGATGDVINFIMGIEHLPFRDAICHLSKEYNVPLPYGKPPSGAQFFGDKGKPIYEAFVIEVMKAYHFATMADTEEIYWYCDGYYKAGAEVRIKEWVEKVFMETAESPCKNAFVNEVIEAVKRRSYVEREMFNLPGTLNVRNGILDVTTKELFPHTPTSYFSYRLPAEYNPYAESPRFEKFLLEIVEPEDVDVIQEMFGYCVYSGNEFQKAFVLVGAGSNGKSTLLNTLNALLGVQNVSSETLQDLSTGRFAVASLDGKLANVCADIPANPLPYTGKFKMLTGGDLLKGEHKFRPSFSFTNKAKLIFSCNQLPQVADQTPAFWRRWIVVKFPHSFAGRENPYLLMELAKEVSGILNFSLVGLDRLLQRKGFSRSTTMADIMEDWKRKSDSVYYFVSDSLEKDRLGIIPKDDLYNAYCDFCEGHNLISVAKSELGKRMPQYIRVKAVRRNIGGQTKHCWQGVKLNGQEGGILELDNEM